MQKVSNKVIRELSTDSYFILCDVLFNELENNKIRGIKYRKDIKKILRELGEI